eukprot:ANDGO_01073.mRNA.1 PHD finger protein rhinoceros
MDDDPSHVTKSMSKAPGSFGRTASSSSVQRLGLLGISEDDMVYMIDDKFPENMADLRAVFDNDVENILRRSFARTALSHKAIEQLKVETPSFRQYMEHSEAANCNSSGDDSGMHASRKPFCLPSEKYISWDVDQAYEILEYEFTAEDDAFLAQCCRACNSSSSSSSSSSSLFASSSAPLASAQCPHKSPMSLRSSAKHAAAASSTPSIRRCRSSTENEALAAAEAPVTMSEDVFEFLMALFEREYLDWGLQEEQDMGKSMRTAMEDDVRCCICNDGASAEGNDILFCDGCNCAVHQRCYGVLDLPPDGVPWFCDRCRDPNAPYVRCAFCPSQLGAFKRTVSHAVGARWAHVSCALWLPEIYFKDDENVCDIAGLNHIDPDRRELVCMFCRSTSAPFSACIQCACGKCCNAFHVSCALEKGIPMWEDKSGVRKAFCPHHASSAPSQFRDRTGSAHVGHGSGSERLTKRLKETRSAVQSEIHEFLLHPKRRMQFHVPTSVRTYTRKQLFEIIDLVYEYWKQRKQTPEAVARQKEIDEQAKRNAEREKLRIVRVELEHLRILCDCLLRRERRKRELARVRLSIALHEMDMYEELIGSPTSARSSAGNLFTPPTAKKSRRRMY